MENQIPDSLPALNVDKPKFYRLFELLLKDEIASLPAGSRVTLSAAAAQRRPADKQEIQVQVSDNGPGLPKEALRLVFDPFVVRSDSPMEYGIHLMACYFIVHHHGGRIEARSEAGQGNDLHPAPARQSQPGAAGPGRAGVPPEGPAERNALGEADLLGVAQPVTESAGGGSAAPWILDS